MTSWLNVSVEVARDIGGVLKDGTADSGSTSTLVDSELTYATDNEIQGKQVVMTSGAAIGNIRTVQTFTASSDTIAPHANFSAAIAAAATYVLTDPTVADFNAIMNKVADGVRRVRRRYFLRHTDATLTGNTTGLYEVPATFIGVSEVRYDDANAGATYPYVVDPQEYTITPDGKLRLYEPSEIPNTRTILLVGVKLLTVPSVYSDDIPDAIQPFIKNYAMAVLRLNRVGQANQQQSAQSLIMANSDLADVAFPAPAGTLFFKDF